MRMLILAEAGTMVWLGGCTWLCTCSSLVSLPPLRFLCAFFALVTSTSRAYTREPTSKRSPDGSPSPRRFTPLSLTITISTAVEPLSTRPGCAYLDANWTAQCAYTRNSLEGLMWDIVVQAYAERIWVVVTFGMLHSTQLPFILCFV